MRAALFFSWELLLAETLVLLLLVPHQIYVASMTLPDLPPLWVWPGPAGLASWLGLGHVRLLQVCSVVAVLCLTLIILDHCLFRTEMTALHPALLVVRTAPTYFIVTLDCWLSFPCAASNPCCSLKSLGNWKLSRSVNLGTLCLKKSHLCCRCTLIPEWNKLSFPISMYSIISIWAWTQVDGLNLWFKTKARVY